MFAMILTAVCVLLVIALLLLTDTSTDLIFGLAIVILITFGVINTQQAFVGFVNEGFLTIAALYVVASGLVRSGAAFSLTQNIFGQTSNLRWAQVRMSTAVALLSAVLNNTAVIAALLANVRDWARTHKIPQSQMLMPMSYAAMLGGSCSLFGSSTNMVVFGVLLSSHPEVEIGIFDVAWVGVPVTIMGIAYMVLFAGKLLPNKLIETSELRNLKEYTVEVMVGKDSPIIGQTITQAGLRNLEGLYLVEIQRSQGVLRAVGPQAILMADDRLIFVGDTDAIVDLRKIQGLTLAGSASFTRNQQRAFVEVVVAQNSSLLGKSLRESAFRTHYNAAVLAVSRHGVRLKGRVGDVVLSASDTLLLECDESFVSQFGRSKEFLLASSVENSEIPNFEKASVAWFILVLMLVLAGSGVLSFFNAALLSAGAMVAARCVSAREARDSIDMVVMLSIGFSFGLASAIEVSGIAELITQILGGIDDVSAFVLLVICFVSTSMLTLLITNTSAAILVLPTMISVAEVMGLSPLPFAITVMMAASASFALPTGYQTNLMVYSVGGYNVSDFIKFGLPLQLLVFISSMLIIPLVWPLVA